MRKRDQAAAAGRGPVVIYGPYRRSRGMGTADRRAGLLLVAALLALARLGWVLLH